MKKFLIILTSLFTLLFYGCGSSGGSSVANQLAPVFTDEEVNYINTALNSLSSNIRLIEKNVNTQKISYTLERTLTDSSGNKTVEKYNSNISKANSLYLNKTTIYTNNKLNFETTDFDLSLRRIIGDYDSNEYFSDKEYSDIFEKHFIDNPSKVSSIKIITRYLKRAANQLEWLDISVDKGTDNHIYYARVFHYNGKYTVANENGIIATEDTLENLVNNTILNNKINSIIDSNK